MGGLGLGLGPLGGMPLGGAVPSMQAMTERPVGFVFRSAGIQFRSLTTGQYTGSWVDISSYVKSWGTLELAIDDVRLNNFTDRGVTLTVNNDTGYFNHQSNIYSLWNGSLTRYRSLLRLQGAFYDTSSVAYTVPNDPTLGIFVLDQEISLQSNSNDVYLRASSLKSVFDEVQAKDIGGLLSATMTADIIIGKIRDHTDGAGVFVFRQFITSTAWSITAASHNYLLNTDNSDNLTAWQLMDRLAEAEGMVVMINRTGGIEFRARGARQGSSQLSLYGQGFQRPSIVEVNEYKEALDKFYSYFRLKFLKPDTETSYVTAGTSTAVNATNVSWFAGSRAYDFENLLVDGTTTAQSVVNNLFSLTAATTTAIPTELTFDATFTPGLEVMDAVDVSYRSYDLANSQLWDVLSWDLGNWGQEGANFDLNSASAYVTAVRHDMDNLKTNLTVRMV